MHKLPTGTAWITGGGSGIGRALALRLAREGWRVAVSGRRPDVLEETCRAADGLPGEIHAFPLDVTDEAACRAVAADIEARLGGIGLAVMNAGIYTPVKGRELSAGVLARHMAVNYQGAVNGLAAVLPAMQDRGTGRVCLVASVAGWFGLPLASGYGPTKAALINLAESLHVDLARYGIGVTLVNPGFVQTPLTAQNRFAMPALTTPQVAAERIWRGLQRGRFEITFPRRFTWFLKLIRSLPYWLYFPLVRKVIR